ncbi:hypothetical protein Dimus_031696, partial [Dionaea muscipula]
PATPALPDDGDWPTMRLKPMSMLCPEIFCSEVEEALPGGLRTWPEMGKFPGSVVKFEGWSDSGGSVRRVFGRS